VAAVAADAEELGAGMRIGIDCRVILDPGADTGAGVSHYVHHLVENLVEEAKDDDLVLFFDNHSAAAARRALGHRHPRVTIRMLPFRAFKKYLPFVRSHLIVAAAFAREGLDVLHGPANALPLFYRGRAVVTVHDLAVYEHPEWFPSGLPGSDSFSQRVVVPSSLSHARRIIAVSEHTRQDVIRIFGQDKAKIEVVHEGVDLAQPSAENDEVLRRHGLAKGEYVLFLGTVEPRKNVDALVRAFVRAASAKRIPENISLVIAGADGWKFASAAEAMGVARREIGERRVRRIGYVPRADKSAVIAGAAAFAYPSSYEGFGLPPLEAMAHGVPVVSSDASSLPEVLGGAALLVPPRDEAALADALVRVLADASFANGLREKGRRRAAELSWRKTARETLAVYRRTVLA
jgi:glycosyltransferase involved in cell wall biosynthesis